MANPDIETAKYLVEKSQDMINQQISAYREKRSIVATIIGLNTLFIPIFLSGFQESSILIKCISLIPILTIIIALYNLVRIYFIHSLHYGIDFTKYEEALNKTHTEALLFEIGANKTSFEINGKTLDKVNKRYQRGIYFTVIAIAFSIIVLSLNMFLNQEKEATKVEITNWKNMSNENNNQTGNNPVPASQPDKVVIPSVPASDLISIKEDTNHTHREKK